MEADSSKVIVAAVQMSPQLKMISENLAYCMKKVDETARNGANLIAFPELALSGYIFESREEMLPIAETVPGPSTEQISQKCASLSVYVVIGIVEKDGGELYNTAVLIGPEGVLGKYRKTHIPRCGADRFVAKGDIPYLVFETNVGKLGLQICYDVHHPEGVRCLALNGADIIVSIANYPEGIEFMPNFVLITRVIENRVHLLACDRVGTERGYTFIGGSMIIDADAKIMARASGEEIIYGKFDLTKARSKRISMEKAEIDLFKDRRPEFYGTICQ